MLGNSKKIIAIIIIAAILIIIGAICYYNATEGVETITEATLI